MDKEKAELPGRTLAYKKRRAAGPAPGRRRVLPALRESRLTGAQFGTCASGFHQQAGLGFEQRAHEFLSGLRSHQGLAHGGIFEHPAEGSDEG